MPVCWHCKSVTHVCNQESTLRVEIAALEYGEGGAWG